MLELLERRSEELQRLNWEWKNVYVGLQIASCYESLGGREAGGELVGLLIVLHFFFLLFCGRDWLTYSEDC